MAEKEKKKKVGKAVAVVSEEKTTEIVVDNGGRNPEAEIKFATRAAKALKDVIDNSGRKTLEIKGQRYLYFEDWQTLGRFFMYTVGTDWTKRIERDGIFLGYESRATIYNKDGIIIGSAEASCLIDEKNWSNRQEFMVKSMAQTRACAKALRNILAWVVVLAGYNPTPAEEAEQMRDTEEGGSKKSGLIPQKDYDEIKSLIIAIDTCKTMEELNKVKVDLNSVDKSKLNDIQIEWIRKTLKEKGEALGGF